VGNYTERFPGNGFVTRVRYWGRNLRYREIFRVLQKYCAGDVIDVGGGSFIRAVLQAKVAFTTWTVLEPSSDDLPDIDDVRVNCIVGDGCAMTQRDGEFDVAVSMQVLEHVFNPMQMMQELHRVIKVGGYIVVVVPQTANIHHLPHHYQNITRYWLEKSAEELGAKIVHYTALGGAWSTLASRLLLQYPGIFGATGYRDSRISRSPLFWLLLPLGIIVSVIAIPIFMLLSLADIKEEANNHVMVLQKLAP